jgi:hypothetical protein
MGVMGTVSHWLSRLLGCVPADELEGIRLEPQAHWEVSPPDWAAVPDFLRLLPTLMPSGSVLYLEGRPASAVRAYLEARAATDTTKVAMGTIWPRPLVFHVGMTTSCLEGLAQLVEQHGWHEFAHHLHVYQGTQVLLEWYDFPDDPFWVSQTLPEDAVSEFCSRLGLQCSEGTEDV